MGKPVECISKGHISLGNSCNNFFLLISCIHVYSSIFTLIGILDTLHSFSFTLLCLPQFGSATCGGMTYVCTNVDPHKYGFYKLIMFCRTVWASWNLVLRSFQICIAGSHGFCHIMAMFICETLKPAFVDIDNQSCGLLALCKYSWCILQLHMSCSL